MAPIGTRYFGGPSRAKNLREWHMHQRAPFAIHDVEGIVLRVLMRAQLFERNIKHGVAGVEIGGLQRGKLGSDVVHANGTGRGVIEKEQGHYVTPWLTSFSPSKYRGSNWATS